ncbi:M20 family metallopeptidase [Desulfobaculum bizertense]|uniref:Succinyl-diaminopimelate desuccinylase n=1 Tax=Desulfobaculum bizertense DSM 18034 TaxID=1121442 RepID=A0A1T4WP07_9BACT|nr:M20/M25/M40 family metallo-hydrolase [Desulfobaculum bizertense]SKA79082.1 succinyl-diaminopimelate desuccinylase [Desulfobaculum bizertense DSM 18034]
MQLSERTRRVLDLTQELMRFPSTASNPDAINACKEFICSHLHGMGVEPECFTFNGTPSIAVLPKHGYAPVLLMAHFDVVDADSEEQFTPQIKDGALYGRGSIDDKYAVAMSLVLFEEHLKSVVADGGSISDMKFGLLLTGDEEEGGHNGAGKVLARISTDFCIALDGGAPESIITKEKGFIRLKITASGKAAHGARPWMGQSAFDVLVKDYEAIKELFPQSDPDHWERTMNLGIVHAGGGSANRVPGSAEGVFDIRYTEKDNPDELLDAIQKKISSSVEILEKEPLFFSGKCGYMDLLLATAGESVSTGFAHGASDARFLTRDGIPAVVWGAEGEASQHGANEHIMLDSLEALTNTMNDYLLALRQSK